MLGLAALHRQQDGLVGDLEAAFQGAGADGFDPGLGVVVPALEEGGFGGGHFDVRSRWLDASIGQVIQVRASVAVVSLWLPVAKGCNRPNADDPALNQG
ncbi:hypothetical protein D3C76_1702560 [compost metagenome]